MEVILLSKEEYQKILDALKEINAKLGKLKMGTSETFIDNADFLRLMKVSRRTAMAWRSEGKITFSQIGSKLYYKLSDIDDMLKRYRRERFK